MPIEQRVWEEPIPNEVYVIGGDVAEGVERGDDSVLEGIYNKQHSLAEIIAPDQFKSYDELKAQLDRALGLSGTEVSTATAESISDDNSVGQTATADDTPWADTPAPVSNSTDSGDSTMSYFEKLANDQ